MTTLLFTGGGGAGNEAIFRSWRNRYELHFADANAESFAPALPKSRCHILPLAGEPDFLESLASVCRRNSVNVLVPGVDEELPLVPQVAMRVPGLKVLVPEAEYVSTMLDKRSTMNRLIAAGIDAPRTTTLDQAGELGFPCFAKPRRGRGSRGAYVVTDAAAADAYLRFFARPADEVVAQELLDGQEYTVIMVSDASRRLHSVVPVRVDLKRGITLRAETEEHEAVMRGCVQIHKACPASGCYNVQLFLTREGRVRPFEINPRVSTTFCLAVASGIDPVEIFIADRLPAGLVPFRAGLRLRRYWYNDIA